MPIIAGMKLTPPKSSILPKVKRGWPDIRSMPIVEINKPINSDANPLITDPVDTITAQDSPRQANQKYSKDENLNAKSAKVDVAAIKTADPRSPPITEQTNPTPSAFDA